MLHFRYFSLQASSPLGFPDNLRFEVESNICREEGPLPDCFAKPRHIVLRTIEVVSITVYTNCRILIILSNVHVVYNTIPT